MNVLVCLFSDRHRRELQIRTQLNQKLQESGEREKCVGKPDGNVTSNRFLYLY